MAAPARKMVPMQARRTALAAQGFGAQAPARVEAAQLRGLVRRLGAVQIDSVNVLVRSHYLPAFSRFGAYDRALLERVAYARPRRLFEYWGHEASLLPIENYPLFRWRMERSRSGTGVWNGVARVGREQRTLVQRVLETISSGGPMSASDFESEAPKRRRASGGWWSWNDTKRAVEYLFWCGEITPLTRRSSFERVYDLTERVIPADVREAVVEERDAFARLVEIAAAAYGVATEADLRDYFRLPVSAARTAIADLSYAGVLEPVAVQGWKQQGYVHAEARMPRRIEGSALLSPFDSLVWNRERIKRLFDFHYRIEIYTPAHKRIHGYYVLPYLVDEALAARVDLKADRGASKLIVHAVHYEPGVDRRVVRSRLLGDLEKMASWLELDDVRLPR